MATATTVKLVGVHPMLIDKVSRILTAMSALGIPMLVTDGVRTLKQQQLLYAQGRTVPGKVVTNADGIVKRSNHQVKTDGWGHAVDCAFLIDGTPSWADSHPWALYGLMAQSIGLGWGGAWAGFVDRPHIELTEKSFE